MDYKMEYCEGPSAIISQTRPTHCRNLNLQANQMEKMET